MARAVGRANVEWFRHTSSVSEELQSFGSVVKLPFALHSRRTKYVVKRKDASFNELRMSGLYPLYKAV